MYEINADAVFAQCSAEPFSLQPGPFLMFGTSMKHLWMWISAVLLQFVELRAANTICFLHMHDMPFHVMVAAG